MIVCNICKTELTSYGGSKDMRSIEWTMSTGTINMDHSEDTHIDFALCTKCTKTKLRPIFEVERETVTSKSAESH